MSAYSPTRAASYNAPQPEAQPPINLSINEREVSLAAGAIAAIVALNRPFSFRGIAMAGLAVGLIRRGMTGRCSVYSKLGVTSASTDHEASAEPESYSDKSIHVEESVTIMKPAAELYAFWRNLENLPKFMEHVKSVTTTGDKRSHWTVRGPMSFNVEWDAEIINDEPGTLIAWQSVGDAEISHAGSVRFLPIGDGELTELRVTMDYIPPAGRIGYYVAKIFQEEPGMQTRNDLRRLKQILEAGEVPTNNHGRPRGNL